MKVYSGDLRALLEFWKSRTLPARFPDAAAWLPERGPLGPAYWRLMRETWSGTVWRRHVDGCWAVPPARAGEHRPGA